MHQQSARTTRRGRTSKEIENLRYAYGAHLDSQDMASLIALFTVDACCDFGAPGNWVGHSQIREIFEGTGSAIGRPFDPFHNAANPDIRLTEPGQAVGRWSGIHILTCQTPESGGILSTLGGHNHPIYGFSVIGDHYRLVNKWRITAMKLRFAWPHKNSDLDGD